MTDTTINNAQIEALNGLVRDYFRIAFTRFDALVASVLLGYVSLYLLSLTVTSSGPQMWFALVATTVTVLGCLYSQVVWAKAN